VIFHRLQREAAGRRVFEELLSELGLDRAQVVRIVATGYGRKSVVIADKAVTEIMCHAAGRAVSILPSGRSSTSRAG